MKKMLLSIKKYYPILIINGFLTIIYVISCLLIPLFFGYILDLFNDEINHQVLNQYVFVVILLIVVSFVTNYSILLINNYITCQATKDIREKAFNKLFKLPISYFDLNDSGLIINNVILNVENYNDSLLIMLNDLPRNVLTILSIIIIMFILSWPIALVLVIFTPLSILITRFLSKKSYKYYNELANKRKIEANIINETIHNQKNIINYNFNDEAIKRFLKANEEYSDISFKSTFISSLVNPSSRLIFSLIYASIAFIASYLVITKGLFTIGVLATLLAYVNQYTKPFNEITSVISEMQNGIASYNHVLAYLNENDDKDLGQEKLGENFDIEFKDLSFSYSENFKLIENFNLHVQEGKKIAIVGKTGAGKTTLINLLMRFYDVCSGDITIGNQSIYNLPKAELRKYFGLVLQDTWIKDGTIYDNLTMGKTYKDDEISQVLQICKLENFIYNLEDGLDTIVSDTKNISIGQRQLLCIARVMLANPKILLLDEATSNIDLQTEIEINNAFNKLMEGKTTFVVAHRLKTIENADSIVVLKNGNIVEIGTHQELLKNGGYYQELYNAQFGETN